MILFKTFDNKEITDDDFCDSLQNFNLYGKSVLVYSRLFSFGRFQDKKAVSRVIEILQNCVGADGCLLIPCHTFSGYNNEIFDLKGSKCKVGVLGEVGRNLPGFSRSIHPIYSHILWGNYGNLLDYQEKKTCFGVNSFYDIFSSSTEPYILMLGTTLNVITNVHYYEQKYSAKSRFTKVFGAKIREDKVVTDIEFESCVRDYNTYFQKVECFANLDSLLTELNLIDRFEFGGSWIHGLQESNFQTAYYNCLKYNPEFYLFASKDICTEYYENNKFNISHDLLHSEKLKNIIVDSIENGHE